MQKAGSIVDDGERGKDALVESKAGGYKKNEKNEKEKQWTWLIVGWVWMRYG